MAAREYSEGQSSSFKHVADSIAAAKSFHNDGGLLGRDLLMSSRVARGRTRPANAVPLPAHALHLRRSLYAEVIRSFYFGTVAWRAYERDFGPSWCREKRDWMIRSRLQSPRSVVSRRGKSGVTGHWDSAGLCSNLLSFISNSLHMYLGIAEIDLLLSRINND